MKLCTVPGCGKERGFARRLYCTDHAREADIRWRHTRRAKFVKLPVAPPEPAPEPDPEDFEPAPLVEFEGRTWEPHALAVALIRRRW